MKKIISLLVLSAFLFSCGTKFSLQKRRYNKGFYFASNHHKKENNLATDALKKTENKTTNTAEVPVKLIVFKKEAKNIETLEHKSVNVFKKKIVTFFSKGVALKNNSNTLKIFTPSSKIQVGQSVSKQKLEKQAIVKKVIRKVLRKIAFLLLIIALVLFVLGLADSTFTLLAVLCASAAVILLIIGLLTRIT
ncbi:MAG: hypothetical protein WCR21_11595 [Bacteroidota bacterium]